VVAFQRQYFHILMTVIQYNERSPPLTISASLKRYHSLLDSLSGNDDDLTIGCRALRSATNEWWPVPWQRTLGPVVEVV